MKSRSDIALLPEHVVDTRLHLECNRGFSGSAVYPDELLRNTPEDSLQA